LRCIRLHRRGRQFPVGLRGGRILIACRVRAAIKTTGHAAAASASSTCTGEATASASIETASAKTAPPGIRGKCADLQREINLGRAGCDLHLTPLRRETEHGNVDGPGSRRQVGEFEFALGVGQRAEDAVALGRADGGAGHRLTFRFDRAGLRASSRNQEQNRSDDCKRPHIH